MNTAVNVNVVHESEAQRQFARVKLPARIRYIGANREGVDARLLDLSAGGFAFTASGAPIQPGDRASCCSRSTASAFPSKWSSRCARWTPASRRVGCEFQNLPREVAAPLPDHLLPGRRGDRRRRHAQYPPARELHQGPQAGRRQRRDGLLRPGPGGDPEHRDLRRRSAPSPSFSTRCTTCTSSPMPIPAWSASPTSRSPCPARAPCRASAQRGSRQRRADRHLLGQPAGHAQGQPDRGAGRRQRRDGLLRSGR